MSDPLADRTAAGIVRHLAERRAGHTLVRPGVIYPSAEQKILRQDITFTDSALQITGPFGVGVTYDYTFWYELPQTVDLEEYSLSTYPWLVAELESECQYDYADIFYDPVYCVLSGSLYFQFADSDYNVLCGTLGRGEEWCADRRMDPIYHCAKTYTNEMWRLHTTAPAWSGVAKYVRQVLKVIEYPFPTGEEYSFPYVGPSGYSVWGEVQGVRVFYFVPKMEIEIA
jgi:hypothetical protein